MCTILVSFLYDISGYACVIWWLLHACAHRVYFPSNMILLRTVVGFHSCIPMNVQVVFIVCLQAGAYSECLVLCVYIYLFVSVFYFHTCALHWMFP